MDFELNDEQQALRDMVRRWVEREHGFERRRRTLREGGFAPAVWQQMAGLGLLDLPRPAAHGGLGLGAIEAMLAMEELGRGLVPEPYAAWLMAAEALVGASPALQAKWWPAACSGTQLLMPALQEPMPAVEPATHAWRDRKLWRLQGRKALVPAGDHAHAFIVAAQLDGEPALLLTEAPAPGVEVGGYLLHDGARAADLLLNDAPAELIARGEAARGLLRAMEQIGIGAQAAEAVGLMDRLLVLVREHLGTRRQFGVTLDSFQALRHRVADMKLQLELARGMSFYATLELARPAAQRRARVFSQVKVQMGQAARFVGQQAVQLHGGIGVSDESVVGHAFKRLSCMELQFGDTLQHLGQVAALMRDEAGVFAD